MRLGHPPGPIGDATSGRVACRPMIAPAELSDPTLRLYWPNWSRTSPSSCFFRSTLILCGDPRLARRHGVSDEDIEYALTHSVTWTELGEDPSRYLLVGPARTGNLLELVVVDVGGEELVIHAMPLRRSTAEELFGDE